MLVVFGHYHGMAGSSEKGPREGWRFAVLAAKCGNHFLQQGVMKSMGVLLPYLVVQLDVGYATAGFLISLQITMNYMTCK